MQKISLFRDWLAESDGPDPDRLAELGLLSGPFVQWRLEITPVSYLQTANPPIGKLIIHSDWATHREDQPYTYTLYPSSFESESEACLEKLSDYYYNWCSLQDFKDWVAAHLAIPVDKYAPGWIEVSRPILCQALPSGRLHWLDPLPASAGLTESADPDPARLIELGLYSGPAIEWRLEPRPGSDLSKNPQIGQIWLVYDVAASGRAHFDRDTWSLYPASFLEAEAEVLRAWRRYGLTQRARDLAALREAVWTNLKIPVNHWLDRTGGSTRWLNVPTLEVPNPVPARQWLTPEFIEPASGEAPHWGPWQSLSLD